jgi:hypothetical protein
MNRRFSRRQTFGVVVGTLVVIGLSVVHLSVVMTILVIAVIAVVGRGAIELVERRRDDGRK